MNVKGPRVPLALNSWKKYMTAPAVIAEIDHLLNEHPDREVAKILNERGFASGRTLPFSGSIIRALRKHHNLTSCYTRLREAGMLDATEMAELLGHAQHRTPLPPPLLNGVWGRGPTPTQTRNDKNFFGIT